MCDDEDDDDEVGGALVLMMLVCRSWCCISGLISIVYGWSLIVDVD